MWKLIRYRRVQSISIALLAALITTCAVFAPLYDRATQQALVDVRLGQVPEQVRGLGLVSSPALGNNFSGATSAASIMELPSLASLVPTNVRRQFRTPVQSYGATATESPDVASSGSGPLLWRAGACDHVTVVDGRCPRAVGEIMVTRADARVFDYRVGSRLRVTGAVDDTTAGQPPPTAALRVVGIYRQVRDAYWFGRILAGRSGIVDRAPPVHVQHDIWLTARSTFEDSVVPPLPSTSTGIDYPLDVAATGIDQLLELGPRIEDIDLSAKKAATRGQDATVYTGLPQLADSVGAERAQSRVIIPLLMLQLGLLALVVLWLVLAAATEQRRPEVALALLRGRGRRGARNLLLRELLPVVLAGVPLGVVAAGMLCWAARMLFLPGAAPFEIRPGLVLTALASAVVLAALTLVAVRRVTREPVETLLRRVPSRRAGWSLGVAETLVLTACGTAVVAFLTGGLTGPIALVAPALLALVVGMLLAHATVPVAAAAGRGLLRRGRVRLGVSVLDAARTPATRRTVAIVTVATALLVFSADALVVGARNRDYAAEQESGAPQVAPVLDSDLRTVRGVLDDVDPSGRTVTPVVKLSPPGTGAPATLAVVPDQFRHIGLFPAQDPARIRWQALDPPSQQPIRLRGTHLTGEISTGSLGVTGPGGDVPPPTVTLDLVDDRNGTLGAPLGTVATGSHTRRFSTELHCRRGCLLSGITVTTTPGSSISGTIGLAGLRADSRPVRIGPASRWDSVDDATTGALTVTSSSDDRLRVGLDTSGDNTVTVHQAWFPSRVPAVVAGRLPAGSNGEDFLATGLSGDTRDARRVVRVPRLPASLPDAAMVNLDVVQRGSTVDPDAQILLWFAQEDPAALSQVTRALAAKGIRVGDTHTLSDVRRTYDESTAAWSLQLAVLVGVAGLLTGILVLLVIAVTTWRLRSRDFAALRMSGVGLRSIRRIAVAEQLIAIGLAVVAGVVCGTVGAHFALPTVPLFATAPAVSTLDLSTAWPAVGVGFAGATVVLALAGWLIGSAIAHRAALERVREAL